MAHLERDRLKSLLWDMLWIQFSCTLYCQWHMHAHLSLFVSIYNVVFKYCITDRQIMGHKIF